MREVQHYLDVLTLLQQIGALPLELAYVRESRETNAIRVPPN